MLSTFIEEYLEIVRIDGLSVPDEDVELPLSEASRLAIIKDCETFFREGKYAMDELILTVADMPQFAEDFHQSRNSGGWSGVHEGFCGYRDIVMDSLHNIAQDIGPCVLFVSDSGDELEYEF